MTPPLEVQEQNNDTHPAIHRARHLKAHIAHKRHDSLHNFERAMNARGTELESGNTPSFTLAEVSAASTSSISMSKEALLQAMQIGSSIPVAESSSKKPVQMERLEVADVSNASLPTHGAKPQTEDKGLSIPA